MSPVTARMLKCGEENDLSKSHGESRVHHPQVTLLRSNHHRSLSPGYVQEDREQHVQELLSTNTAGMKGKPSFVLRAVGTWGHPEFRSQGGGGAGMAGHRRTQSMNGTGVHALASIFSSSCIRDDN